MRVAAPSGARSAAARLGAVLAVLLGGLAVVAGPARSHGPTGTLGIEATPGPAPLTAAVRVLLEYENDRDVAPGATVVAQATGPGGQVVGPAPLADRGQGVYDGTLTMPAAGAWTVAVTAENPAATAQAVVEVVATAPTTEAPTAPTTGGLETSSDTAERAGGGGSGDEDDGGLSPAVIVVIVLVVTAATTATVILVRRRR